MCKVLGIVNVSKLDRLDFKNLIEHSAKIMQGQRDGFGWAASVVNAAGEVRHVGERTSRPDKFVTRLKAPNLSLPFAERWQNTFGDDLRDGEQLKSFIAHGRISTNNPALLNAHPIVRDGWSLIHNGVVTHHGPKYQMTTQNDSEHVLFNLQTGGIEAVAKNLTGYYAFLALDPAGNFHLGRDTEAPLFVAWVPKIESYIYATKGEDITDLVQKMYWNTLEISPVAKLFNDVYAKHELASGAITWQKFVSLGRDEYSAKKAHLSLGRELEEKKPQATSQTKGQEETKKPSLILSLASSSTYGNNSINALMDERTASGATRYTSTLSKIDEKFYPYDRVTQDFMSQEAIKEQKRALFACCTEQEKKYLGEFFAFINSPNAKFEVWSDAGKSLSIPWFLGLPPARQIAYEVVLPEGGYLDPFNGLFGGKLDEATLLEALDAQASDRVKLQALIEDHRAQQEICGYGI